MKTVYSFDMNSTVDQDTSALQGTIEQAMTLLQEGNASDALHLINTLLDQYPDNRDGLYSKAVSERVSEDFISALSTLSKLQKLHPQFGRAFQEEGHIHFARGENDKAKQAYARAVSLNNSLIASWRTLAGLHGKAGETSQAQAALHEYNKLNGLPQALLAVRNMMAEGRLKKAETTCRHFLRENPTHIEGMRLLADLGVKTGVLDDAEFILESAVEFDPDNNLARFDYMNVLYRRQKYAHSLEQSKILLKKDPENMDYRIGFANQSVAIGDYDAALDIYDDALTKAPHKADLNLVHGHALKTIGQIEGAVQAYRKTYECQATYGDAYWSLANLKTYKFTDQEVIDMLRISNDASTDVEDRAHFCFALGKHFEDVQDYQQAFEYYERGNALRQSQLQYSPALMRQRFESQQQHCNAALFESHKGQGCTVRDPIFIVGLPRAGSTLLEQILASHSQIDGTLELPNISSLAYQLGGRRRVDEEPKYPGNLKDLSSDQLQKFGQAFIDDTQIHRQGAPFFIDKMPNNFRHIGLIQLILPNAKIIDARRHPMGCCFSGFKQLFASGQEFTYGLEQIGQYYRDYVALMDHWDRVLPGKILRVQYEDVVGDLESQVRRMLDYLELPFEEACVSYHKTERSVRTPSAEQVRQPIFKSGLEQWRNFEPWLGPLEEALGPILGRYPIT